MKKLRLASALLWACMACIAGGCSDDNDAEPTDGGLRAGDRILFEDGRTIGNGDSEFVFTGRQTLKKGVYRLKGWVYVGNGAELTIEPGTVILGNKATRAALIVERGGKLFAKGTASEPIVFTSEQPAGSRRPGDWGGLILCGKARTNQGEQQIEGGPRTKHGGEDDNDNSGILSYVRIEFAGYPFEQDKEINGLTLGSVGRGTQVDHVQVSYSNDDSYEWFGGTVNCSHLISFHSWDDDFDTDNGFSGKVQFCLGVRDPHLADISQSNGFESDNSADGAAIDPYTSCCFSNVTFVGPCGRKGFANNGDYINGGALYPDNGSGLGRFQAAMQIRRNSRLNCYNTVAVGFPVGLMLDNQKGDSQKAATDGLLNLKGLCFGNMDITGSDANKIYEDRRVVYDADGKASVTGDARSFSTDFFLQEGNRNRIVGADEMKLTGAASPVGADYLPQNGSCLLEGAVDVPAGLVPTDYIGAFSGTADDWMAGWTEFDPQHADYPKAD